jgi:Raf kinase inhibitor-like YbhB/YbcL family protein
MRRVIAGLLVAVALAGCAGGGPSPSTSAEPSVSTAPSSPAIPPPVTSPAPSALSPAPEATMPGFALTSPAFAARGAIPRRFTCDAEDVSPELSWTGTPAGTGALVLLVDDPDARGWVHWIVLDLPGADGSLPEGVVPSADRPAQGRNDFGRPGWGGPCPPSGTHRYVFTLYALAAPLGLSGNPDEAAVQRALSGASVLDVAVLDGTYRRGS